MPHGPSLRGLTVVTRTFMDRLLRSRASSGGASATPCCQVSREERKVLRRAIGLWRPSRIEVEVAGAGCEALCFGEPLDVEGPRGMAAAGALRRILVARELREAHRRSVWFDLSARIVLLLALMLAASIVL